MFESHQFLQTACSHGHICNMSLCLRSQSFLQKAAAAEVCAEGTLSGLQKPDVALSSHLSAACPMQHLPVSPHLYMQAAHRLFICLSLTQLEK